MAYKAGYIWNGTSFDQIGNQAVATLTDYAQLSPVSQTITNTTLTSPTINGGSADSVYLISPSEKTTVVNAAAGGTINFDVITQGVLYYELNASSNITLNVRGNASTTLASMMSNGESISIIFLSQNGSTARYVSSFTIDGSVTSVKWSGGTAPSSGNSSATDAYSFTIIKSPSYGLTVFGSMGKFA